MCSANGNWNFVVVQNLTCESLKIKNHLQQEEFAFFCFVFFENISTVDRRSIDTFFSHFTLCKNLFDVYLLRVFYVSFRDFEWNWKFTHAVVMFGVRVRAKRASWQTLVSRNWIFDSQISFIWEKYKWKKKFLLLSSFFLHNFENVNKFRRDECALLCHIEPNLPQTICCWILEHSSRCHCKTQRKKYNENELINFLHPCAIYHIPYSFAFARQTTTIHRFLAFFLTHFSTFDDAHDEKKKLTKNEFAHLNKFEFIS